MTFDQKTMLYRQPLRPEVADVGYKPPKEETTLIPKGFRLSKELAAFSKECIYEKDVPVTMRDGVKLNVDMFRLQGQQERATPAIIHWSPYGKTAVRQGGFDPIDITPGRVGIPVNRLSGYQKFEGLDPAEWIERGYAIINPDVRGVYDSDGDMAFWGTQEGRDGYDLIEHIASLDWCNGKVGMAGNSWLAIGMWFIAAERPPHLTCIAPFESTSDLYQECLCRGGVPQPVFPGFISKELRGQSKQEDIVGMLKKYPNLNSYWADKRARMDLIQVPTYIVASYGSSMHIEGSFRGFRDIPHQEKWLRIHATNEWHDLYLKSTNDELQEYFDYYLKGQENDWKQTPRVRACFLRMNQSPVHFGFPSWPLPNVKEQSLYLDGKSLQLIADSPSGSSEQDYQSDVPSLQCCADDEELSFTYTFKKPSVLSGCARAILYMSCSVPTGAQEKDREAQFDVHVQLRKADRQGRLLEHYNIPLADCEANGLKEPPMLNKYRYLGPHGCLRAHYRQIKGYTADGFPEYELGAPVQEVIEKDEVVKLEIGLVQTGMTFEAGERLIFKVSGHEMGIAEYEFMRGEMPNFNQGKHTLHCGGNGDGEGSRLVLPLMEDFDWKAEGLTGLNETFSGS